MRRTNFTLADLFSSLVEGKSDFSRTGQFIRRIFPFLPLLVAKGALFARRHAKDVFHVERFCLPTIPQNTAALLAIT